VSSETKRMLGRSTKTPSLGASSGRKTIPDRCPERECVDESHIENLTVMTGDGYVLT
jgi:hypothetical protein